MDGVNVLAMEAVNYMTAGQIVVLCISSVLCILSFIGIIISILKCDTSTALGLGVISFFICLFISIIILSRPQKIYYYLTIEDTASYVEFSEEYKVEKHIGDLYIATKLEKDD